MLFNSIEFAVFFPIVTAVYFLLPQRLRVLALLIASCIFYMAFIPAYIVILFATILTDYFAGMYIETAVGTRRRMLLVVSIGFTCLILFVFKYLNFFTTSFEGLAAIFGMHVPHAVLGIILPVGLSFHTFQSLSYVIEVYRGHQKAEKNFIVYATYVMFFPQLVAGPIERPQNLLHQFREWHSFNYADVTEGLRRMAWGFFKKLVIADRLALYVNDVYAAPRDYNGLQLTIATCFFAYQIYCDFSGYSDIAIGTAQILGFRLMENFRTPYYSRSISEFWRRWHISLSTWFKDYLYISLGGNRVSVGRHVANLMITFTVSGLWHGANWTYVCWGFLNGVYLVSGSFTQSWRRRIAERIGWPERSFSRRAVMQLTTFALICVAWILFRAQNLGDALYVFTHLAQGWDPHNIKTPHFLLRQFPVAIAGLLILELGQLWSGRISIPSTLSGLPRLTRWGVYAAFVAMVVMFGVYQSAQFIYFQF